MPVAGGGGARGGFDGCWARRSMVVRARIVRSGSVGSESVRYGIVRSEIVGSKIVRSKTVSSKSVPSRQLDPRSIAPRSFDSRSWDPRSLDPRSFDPRSWDPRSPDPSRSLQERRIQDPSVRVRRIQDRSIQDRQLQIPSHQDPPSPGGLLKVIRSEVCRSKIVPSQLGCSPFRITEAGEERDGEFELASGQKPTLLAPSVFCAYLCQSQKLSAGRIWQLVLLGRLDPQKRSNATKGVQLGELKFRRALGSRGSPQARGENGENCIDYRGSRLYRFPCC